LVKCRWISDGRSRPPQAFAGQIDPIGIVDDAVENGTPAPRRTEEELDRSETELQNFIRRRGQPPK
jgi:hypothetical protein